MSRFLGLCFGTFLRLFRSHPSLLLENLALRSTARRAQAAPSTPKVVFVRQALLAAHPSMLVRLETGAPRRHTRNRRAMAPRRIPLVLEDDFEDQEAHRWETDTERGSGSHLPNGDREPELGSSPHPRRTSDARF